jgi:Ca-activated chloride channel family protein
VAALAAPCWGLVTLLELTPKVHQAQTLDEGDYRHIVLVLDVSPSMRLVDAGPKMDQSRMRRARELMESFFKRVAVEQYRISVVATYNGAKPVVVDTRDIEVVRNILSDLPMHHAFQAGKTDIFAGLQEAAGIARTWNPRSTTLVLVSDGDTVPATGMPKMPASVSGVLVVGVGDPRAGKFIDGRQSRQEVSTLRQLAVRLGGTYHNGNEKHLASATLQALTAVTSATPLERLTRREYALIACGSGATLIALLSPLLHLAGTRWRPGVPAGRTAAAPRRNSPDRAAPVASPAGVS